MMAVERVIGLYASRQFGRFVLTGGIAALLHWLSRFAFNLFMLPRQLAFALGHGCGVALPVFVNFVLHKSITFRGA